MVACGALGMLAADGHRERARRRERHPARGRRQRGRARDARAWAVLKAGELRADPDEDVDVIGAAVCAAVLIMLPLVEDFANVFAGLAGALVGAACGCAAGSRPPRAAARSRPVTDKFTALTPSCTATRSSTAPSATASCPRSRRAGGGDGRPGADADRRRPGGVHDDPRARRSAPAARSRSAPSWATARSRSPAACPRTASWSACEFDEELRRRARASTSSEAGLADRVEHPLGPALETLRAMPEDGAVRLRLHRRRQGRATPTTTRSACACCGRTA